MGSNSVELTVADPSQTETSSVMVNVPVGVSWTAQAFPTNSTTSWLTVSPIGRSGPFPLSIQAKGSGLGPGAYSAWILVSAPNAIPQSLILPISFTVGGSPDVSIGGVLNGASFERGYAPGSVLSVFGQGLAPSTKLAGSVPLPLNLAGVSATVNNVAAPLYFVSAQQVNIQIPYETGSGPAILGIDNNGKTASYIFNVTPNAPGIFASNGSLAPVASAKQGQTISMFITGDGDISPSLLTGQSPVTGTMARLLPQPLAPVSVTVGGEMAATPFVGIPAGLVGTTQINFTIPADARAGVQPVVVTVGTVPSAPVNLTVNPGP